MICKRQVQKQALFADRLYLPAHFLRYFQEHVVQLARVDALLVLAVLLVGILLRLVERDARHLVLRLAHHRGVQLLVGEEIVQVDIAYHRHLEKVHVLVLAVGVVAHKHVAGYAHQYRLDVDGTQQGSEQDAAVHAINLRRLQRIVESTYPLGKDNVARKTGIRYRAVAEVTLLQYVPQGIHLLVNSLRRPRPDSPGSG